MNTVILERYFEDALTPESVSGMVNSDGHCYEIRNIAWLGSYLSSDGHQLTCTFSSPDTESVRSAARETGSSYRHVWPCTVHTSADDGDLIPNVIVERTFEEPVVLADIQAIEDAGSWCLETWDVRFVRTFFSSDRTRMLCLYQAPDAESVRRAQRQAGMPFKAVWAMELINPS